jgi:hypothetical protein
MDVLTADLLLVADSDFSRYKPAYVDAFFEHRVPGDDQSIEEWTAREGRTMFSADEIYQPCSIGIRVMGSEANLFQFDATQPNWCDSLTGAVHEMLIAHQLASKESNVKLVDIRGDPILNTTPMHEVEQGGELLVTVDGKRLLDETRLTRQIGLPLATPVSHAPNKDDLLEEHVRNMIAVDIRDLVLEALSRVENMVAAEAMICNEDDPTNLLKPIAALVKGSAGHARSFAHLLDIHAAPDVVEALQNERVTDDDFADDIAGAVLDEVAQSMQAKNMRISDYFTAKQMEHSNLFATVQEGKAGAGARTIFGSQVRTHTEQIGQILNECPTTRHMFQDIVDHALFENQQLEGRINIIIKKGCDKHRRRNKRSAYRHGKRNAHHHHHHRHTPALKHGAKVRDYHFRDHHDHSRMHNRLHRLLQIAPAPGTEPLVVQENWHGKKHHWHRTEGQMENYRGSFPHHGLHDGRYSQNTSVSDGGRGYGPGSAERDAKIRDYKYSAEYERKHGRHYREAVAGVKPSAEEAKRSGPPKEKGDQYSDSEDESEGIPLYNQIPAMALHKDAPALESVKTSPDTKTITVSKEPSPAVTLPPAAEVVKVQAKDLPDGELIAATLRSAEVLQDQEISEKDMALIRATLRSAEAVTETSFTVAAKKKPVASKSIPAAAPATVSAPVPVREEPPSMQMFNKDGETKAPATTTGGGGYKVHQRVVVVTPVVSKAPVAAVSSPKVSAAAALPKVVLPVETNLSDALMDDDADLNMLLIPQATAKSIRV